MVLGKPMTRRQRVFRWLILLALVALWVASGELFPGNSRLYDAIEKGDVSAAKRLLDEGSDPNSRWRGLAGGRTEGYIYSPLIYALRRNQPAIALELLRAGADPAARDPRGGDAFALAADGDMRDVMQALIARGAGPAAAPPAWPYGRAPH
jgi:ankyrin repeat protein